MAKVKDKAAPKPVRRTIDWEAIQMRYRAGTESLRSIGDHFGVTEGAIRQKAKKGEWTRDLQKRVQLATEALLISHEATHSVRTEAQCVAVEAKMRANVVIGHRTGLKRIGGLRDKLLGEIENVTDNVALFETLGELLDESGPDQNGTWRKDKLNEVYRKVISVSGRIDDAKKLAEIDEKVRKGEREAFNIDATADDKTGVDDLILRVNAKLKAQLGE